MSDDATQPAPPGICLIKPQYLVKDHERSLSHEHVSKEDLVTLNQQHTNTHTQTQSDNQESAVLNQPDTLPPHPQSQPDHNKRIKLDRPNKLKGQNRDRRGSDRSEWRSRVEFCPSLTERLSECGDAAALCPRGGSCKYQHDARAYLSSKPPDIGSHCYVYRLTGHCLWGISCRFGGDHLSEEGVNLVEESVRGGGEGVAAAECRRNSNPLDKETVTKLWKKRYDFSRSNRALTLVENSAKQTRTATTATAATTAGTAEVDGLVDTMEVQEEEVEGPSGAVDDCHLVEPTAREKKKVDWRGLLYLSPLTTVGNLPFRRICVEYGADITCSEMCLALSLLQGTREWSLLRRHPSEKIFGVQICGNNPMVITKTAQLLEEKASLDFVDLNLGCPIDALYQQGCGSGMMARKGVLRRTCEAVSSVLTRLPLTVKLRTGLTGSSPLAHSLMPLFRASGVSLATVHGRSREQRYTRNADWSYIDECALAAAPMPVYGNGDILSHLDYQRFLEGASHTSGAMIGRGALIKPWIFTEIKERRQWDISSSERFDIIKKYVNYGLQHWGSDTRGVETTRRFLLEWLSFLHRYVPVGLLERPPQLINQRPPVYRGRDDMETLMASANCAHWIQISEMLLGPVPEGFVFLPKHKSNAWK